MDSPTLQTIAGDNKLGLYRQCADARKVVERGKAWIRPSVQESCTIGKERIMATETTYTSLRENLASVLDQVVDQQETVIIRRRGARDVALIPAGELAALIETAHLLLEMDVANRLTVVGPGRMRCR